MRYGLSQGQQARTLFPNKFIPFRKSGSGIRHRMSADLANISIGNLLHKRQLSGLIENGDLSGALHFTCRYTNFGLDR